MKLELTRIELANIVKGQYSTSNGPLNIRQLASLERAQAQDVSFIFDATQAEKLSSSSAGYFITNKIYDDHHNYLLVTNPLEALAKLEAYKKTTWISDTQYDTRWPHAYVSLHASIDPTVQIEPGVIVKSGASIGAHTILKAHAYIDHDVNIENNVMIGPHVTIHDGTLIQSHVSIDAQTTIGADGYGYQPTPEGFIKIPHTGNVIIGPSVELGANVCIDRAVFDSTVIEEGCKIDNHVYIAHNVHIKKHTLILGHVIIGGSSTIGSWCKIGAQTAIKDHITIGDFVDVVGKSGIMNDIASKQTVAGFPADSFFAWKKQIIGLKKLPEILKKMSRP